MANMRVRPYSLMINCTCNERLPGRDCLSVELLSLLICGEVNSSFQGWPQDSNAVGFGILSSEKIGAQLKHPSKPVWMLRGDACHTVTWIDATKMPLFDMTQFDQQWLLQLSHWNVGTISGMYLACA